ncbi:MAG: hypothetical protein AAGF23_14185, partial [Acidobacteriota bacterium]
MDTASFGRPPWWRRDGLEYVDKHLHLAGRDVAALARELGTPLFLYDSARVAEKLLVLRRALDGSGLRGRVLYAMKANRFVPLLCHLRALGAGIDACSPAEVALARQVGFRAREISFTATSLSTRDLEALARSPEVLVNCDSLSTVRRLAALAPGRGVGLRIDPGLGVGYRDREKLRYAGGRHAKLGIALDRADEALHLARRSGLRVTGLHVHAGCGYLTPQLPDFDRILARLAALAERIHDLERINVGGGLGTPLTAEDEPLDLRAWAEIVAGRLGNLQTPAGGAIEIQVDAVDCKRAGFRGRAAGEPYGEITDLQHGSALSADQQATAHRVADQADRLARVVFIGEF